MHFGSDVKLHVNKGSEASPQWIEVPCASVEFTGYQSDPSIGEKWVDYVMGQVAAALGIPLLVFEPAPEPITLDQLRAELEADVATTKPGVRFNYEGGFSLN